MTTYTGFYQYIGKRGSVPYGNGRHEMRIAVTVLDAREVWGRVDLLIAPVTGEGSTWVSRDSVWLDA